MCYRNIAEGRVRCLGLESISLEKKVDYSNFLRNPKSLSCSWCPLNLFLLLSSQWPEAWVSKGPSRAWQSVGVPCLWLSSKTHMGDVDEGGSRSTQGLSGDVLFNADAGPGISGNPGCGCWEHLAWVAIKLLVGSRDIIIHGIEELGICWDMNNLCSNDYVVNLKNGQMLCTRIWPRRKWRGVVGQKSGRRVKHDSSQKLRNTE